MQTKHQSSSTTWFDQRQGKLLASKFHKIYSKANTIQTKEVNELGNTFYEILGQKNI